MDYTTVADDFFLNMNLHTALKLPSSRETVLHFCEAVQKEFPQMTTFFQRDSGEFVLEGDRDADSYRWLEIQSRRLSAGYFNPSEMAMACHLHRWVLKRSVYYLGVGPLDVESLDVAFGFNMDYHGNRDAIVAEALLSGSHLGSAFLDEPGRSIGFEPTITLAMDEECCLQARLVIETRCGSYQVRTGQYEDEPISVYFTVRGYPRQGGLMNMDESFEQQCELAEDMVDRLVIPHVINPIAAAIAAAQ